jgi:hypothetical protein
MDLFEIYMVIIIFLMDACQVAGPGAAAAG